MPWYVVAQEPENDESEFSLYRNVWGPFNSGTDAQAFAIDLWEDNGWGTVAPLECEHADAARMASNKSVIYPYK